MFYSKKIEKKCTNNKIKTEIGNVCLSDHFVISNGTEAV
jgi:hypothetical protein